MRVACVWRACGVRPCTVLPVVSRVRVCRGERATSPVVPDLVRRHALGVVARVGAGPLVLVDVGIASAGEGETFGSAR